MRRTLYHYCERLRGYTRKSLLFPFIVAIAFLIMGRARAATSDAWSKVAPSGAGFTALMPGGPEEHTATIPTSVGPAVMHIYLLHDGSKFYSVSYSDYPATPALSDARAALRGARDGALRKAENAVMLRDVDFTFQRFPAKGIVLELWGGQYIYRCRMYLVGTRLYQLVFAAPPLLAHAVSGGKFLSSFHLLPGQEDTFPLRTWLLTPTQTPPVDGGPDSQTGSRTEGPGAQN